MKKGTLHLNMTGEAAELYFMARAAALGLIVSKPLQQNVPYDVIIEARRQLRRVQVKASAYHNRGWYYFRATRQGCSRRTYDLDEIDYIVCYVMPLDTWYIIPIGALRKRVSVNVNPATRGGQFEPFRERWDLLWEHQPAVASGQVPAKSSAHTTAGERSDDVVEQRQVVGIDMSATLGKLNLEQFNNRLVACTRCPRLVAHRQQIGREKRRAYMDCEYWAKPVPGFGDPAARVLILGLAPGAHGSNRTGRMFTGDGSGNFLYAVLHRTGFASQPEAKHREDGLRLTGAYITAAVHCAPPLNKPTRRELANCSAFLDRELELLTSVRVVVALGHVAFDAYLNHLKRRGLLHRAGKNGTAGDAPKRSQFVFAHGASYDLPDGRILLASYHPSQQNTHTGKLTEKMLTQIFRKAARLAETS